MAPVPQTVLDLVAGIHAFDSVLAEIEAEWAPDPAPLTTSMVDLGRVFAEGVENIDRKELATILDRLEQILRHGEEHEKNAVATGFLESMVVVLDAHPERKWLLQYAGPESLHYIAAWNRLCGIDADHE